MFSWWQLSGVDFFLLSQGNSKRQRFYVTLPFGFTWKKKENYSLMLVSRERKNFWKWFYVFFKVIHSPWLNAWKQNGVHCFYSQIKKQRKSFFVWHNNGKAKNGVFSNVKILCAFFFFWNNKWAWSEKHL